MDEVSDTKRGISKKSTRNQRGKYNDKGDGDGNGKGRASVNILFKAHFSLMD